MKLNELNLPVLPAGKAGIIPFIIEDGQVYMMFMESSDAEFGGPDPMIAKGHVDPGESFAITAMREGFEELGLKPSNCANPRLAWKGELSGMDNHYEFHVYTVQVRNKTDFGTPHFETKAVHWLTPKEFASKGRPSQNHIVQAIAKSLHE